MNGAMLASCVLKDCSAPFALYFCHFVNLRVSAMLTDTIYKLVSVLLAVPFRLILALLRTVLLCVLSQPFLTGCGCKVKFLPQVLSLPFQMYGSFLVETSLEVFRLERFAARSPAAYAL
jgi:hypothetical protein